jgi:ribosomal protein S12 methylthiotransferase accessory factor
VQTREWAKYLGDDRAAAAPPAWHDVRTFEDHVFLHAYGGLLPEIEFLTSGRTATSPDWHSQTTGGSTVDLACALTLLRARGLDAIALDLTTIDVAEAGYCVTKVFMPELQPLYADERQPFLGGSRLYDLPRRLGYTSRNTTLAELNSVPHPYP